MESTVTLRSAMQRQLEIQSAVIETILGMHEVPARVTGGTVAPRCVRFQVLPEVGTAAQMERLSEDMELAFNTPCRIARRGAAFDVEIPRSDPEMVQLIPLCRQLVLEEIPPVTAVLGLADDGAPLLIRLPSPDVSHVLVAGTTGAGKTVLLQTIILSLALLNQPGEMRIVLLDPKGSAFPHFAGLPHLSRPVIREAEEAKEALESLVRLMETQANLRRQGPRVVVVIDDLANLLMWGRDALQCSLTRLLQRGREARIHIVAATQEPTLPLVKPLVEANFPVRLVGRVANATDARVATGRNGTGADRLEGTGDFVAVAEGQVTRFQAAYVEPNEFRGHSGPVLE
jgi:S-DNA-T family DNA segregation ATPase FtsK/SpoIIIE